MSTHNNSISQLVIYYYFTIQKFNIIIKKGVVTQKGVTLSYVGIRGKFYNLSALNSFSNLNLCIYFGLNEECDYSIMN